MMKKIFLLIVLFGFNAMAADVFPGFESAPQTDSVPTENKPITYESNPKAEVDRKLQEGRAMAIEQKTFDKLDHPHVQPRGVGQRHFGK